MKQRYGYAIVAIVVFGAAACARHSFRLAGASRPASLGATADTIIARYAMYGFSGTVLLVDSGLVVLEKGYGSADNDRGVPATAATRYDVGSITKTFTAAAVLKLVSEGLVSVDEPIAKYFGGDVPQESQASVRRVLTHTAGFPLDPSDAGITSSDPPQQYIGKALRYDLSKTMGKYSYSNTGYGLLALMVEQVTRQSFRTYVTEALLRPNGLSNTGWWNDSVALDLPRVARGYTFSDREDVLVAEPPVLRANRLTPIWAKWPLGAAGIVTTVGDLNRWMTALESNGVLSDSLTRAMFTPEAGNAGSQGYGWSITTRPGLGMRVSRGGARTGFTSLVASYPQRRGRIVFALNQSQEALWQSVILPALEHALAGVRDSLPPPTVSLSAIQLDALEGFYSVGSSRIRVLRDGSELLVGADGQDAVNLLLNRPASAGDTVANHRSRAIAVALLRGDVNDAVLTMVNSPAQLATWLKARWNPGDSAMQVLGTAPHSSGNGRTQTFMRLGATESATVVRLIWQNGQVIAWGDGIRLPAFRRFRTTSDTSAVAYTPREPNWITLEVLSNGRQASLVIMHNGVRSAPAPRQRD